MDDLTLSLDELRSLTKHILIAHKTSEANASQVAEALMLAEADGQKGHGASRIPSYAAQSLSGKVDGHATPTSVQVGAAALRIDARSGFAYPALNLATEDLANLAHHSGIAAASVAHSHHSGVAGHQVEALARRGLVALSFGNGPVAIAPWGGNKGVFGTNPLAFAAPRPGLDPLVIDMSLSKVARGKINAAAQVGETIPEGWALDTDGNPTTDPKAALNGNMLPMGDAKGAQLVLMVEILAAALSASQFGYEASSFFTGEGDPPHVGQLLIAINPEPFSDGGFSTRICDLLSQIEVQPETRLPGSRRYALRARAELNGITIPSALAKRLRDMPRSAD
ncbi:MAG: (2R)-3-sulfolactate dehydrogenase (NADP(+)) [Alphaproteobacteria bacterium MarineAlpha4_Bin2]|nr:MAG: (2R)-3-sulfolactate dehydrogenase (NADP(+)) [Alphaproteobacteria bacterium MarineAlpha4_Bin2]